MVVPGCSTTAGAVVDPEPVGCAVENPVGCPNAFDVGAGVCPNAELEPNADPPVLVPVVAGAPNAELCPNALVEPNALPPVAG